MSRRVAATALVVLAALAIALALVAGYVRRAAVDSDQFANRATAALEDDSVRTLVAQRVTDEVVLEHEGDLLAARPIIESVVSGLVGSRAFTTLFRAAVRDVHRAVFARDQDTVTLTLADVGTVAGAALEHVKPGLARKLERTGKVELVRRDVGATAAGLARLADTVRRLALILALVALTLVACALLVTPDRRRTVVELGTAVATAGLLLVVAYAVARALAVDRVDGADQRAAAGAVWDAFLADLGTQALVLAGSGAVVAAAAASLIRPVDLGEPLRRAGGWLVAEPRGTGARIARGLLLVVAGVLVLAARDVVLDVLLVAAGILLVFAGVTALLRLVYRPEERPREPAAPARHDRRRRLAAPVLALALIGGAVAALVAGGGTTTAAPPAGGCDGHVALCDRRLDDVVLPATHNAMSVPLPGWYSAEQDRPIAGQLADGIRGLLIDTHYADRLPNGRLRTSIESEEAFRAAIEQDGISDETVAAARRIRDRLGFAGEGERGMYLCHAFCELGGTPLASALDDLRDFLVAHPGAVVVVINQDYVTPADFVGAVRDAGLERFAYRGPTGDRWWTLRQMVDTGQRVVFLAENHAGAAPWYHLAYRDITEETPYTFPKASQLTRPAGLATTCRPNRGPADAPLFLLNHWVSTDPVPKPSDAAKVNAYEPLLRRARECQRIRHHLPNLVAVNFYRRGDLLQVVDTLNGVR